MEGMEKFNVVIKSYDDDDYREVVTKEPVSYGISVSMDRGVNINLNQDDYYTTIEKAE